MIVWIWEPDATPPLPPPPHTTDHTHSNTKKYINYVVYITGMSFIKDMNRYTVSYACDQDQMYYIFCAMRQLPSI